MPIAGAQRLQNSRNRSGRVMQDRANDGTTTGTESAARAARRRTSRLWAVLAGIIFGLVAGAITARLAAGPTYDGLLMFTAEAAGVAAALLALRMRVRNPVTSEPSAPTAQSLKELLDSAGPMVMAAGLDGRFIYLNPAAERLLGYHASQLMGMASAGDILPQGEGDR